MANTCENSLEITGEKDDISNFMANVFEVEQGGIEYRVSDSKVGHDILPFGWLQSRDESSIVFDSKWGAPTDNILAMSKLHPALTFTVTYVIPNDEVAGIAEIKNAEIIRDEYDSHTSDLARELFGDDYVNDLIAQDICRNFLEIEGEKEEITQFMAKVCEIENSEIEYRVEDDEESDPLHLGRLQARSDNAIAFDSEYEAPLDNIIEISSLHPELTFTFSYAIPAEETVSRLEIKDEEVLDEEEDDIYSDLAREMLGNEYVDEL